jgi:membrane protease YdiL (CAAX protease family)
MKDIVYLEPYTYQQYGLPRRIWRSVYPFVIFLGISIGVEIIITFVLGIVMTFQVLSSLADPSLLDPTVVIDNLLDWTMTHLLEQTIAYQVIAVAVFVPMWLKTRTYRPETERPSLVLPIVLSALALPGVSLVFSYALSATGLDETSETFMEMMEAIQNSSILLQVLSAVILAPIVEELCFRGLILNRSLYWMPKWAALLLQGVLFGVMHLNVPQGIFAALVGILLGMLYIRYRSLWVSIAAHLAVNGISTLVNNMGDMSSEEATAAQLAIIISCIVLSIISIIVIFKTKAAKIVVNPVEPLIEEYTEN